MPRNELAEKQVIAMTDYVSERSVVVFLHDEDDTPRKSGSGTCLQIAGRFFVATAGHVIADWSLKQIGVIGAVKRTDLTPLLVGSGLRGGGTYDPVDIGWLELHPQAAKAVGWTFVGLEKLSLRPISDSAMLFIRGFPVEFQNMVSYEDRPLLQSEPLNYLLRSVREIDPRRYPNHSRDVFLEYLKDINEDAPDGFVKQAPDAQGLSGCGIWKVNPRLDTAIGSPDSAQLAGVFHTWYDVDQLLQGTLITEWLQMLRADLPELAANIDPLLEDLT